jgi:hypothetical protein
MARKKREATRKSSLERRCEKTSSNVLKFPEFRKHKNTIYFCSFKYHRGIIKNPALCQENKCTHYREIPVADLIENEDYRLY